MSSSAFCTRQTWDFFQYVLGGLDNLIQIKKSGFIGVATANPMRTGIPEE